MATKARDYTESMSHQPNTKEPWQSSVSARVGEGMSYQSSEDAFVKAVLVGTSATTKQFLAQPKNQPYYRQFAKTRF
jgi:hypothetical protein